MMCSPRQSRACFCAITACLAAAALTGCANSRSTGGGGSGGGGSGVTGTGGLTGTGGVAGTGGLTGSGGVAGTGGLTGSGGMTGSGGVMATGGLAGTGGLVGTGGLAGTGGVTGTGGIAGSGGVTGSGGVMGTGGVTGSGGMMGTGGLAGLGGVMGSGGVAGSDGSAGSGGSSSLGGITGTGGFAGGGGTMGGSTGSGGASGGAGGTSNTCPPATPLTGGKQYCSNTKGNVGGGYAYELWASGSGSGCMTVYGVDANFGATWTNVGDFLARIGLGFDQTKTPAQIGTISADFAERKTVDSGLVYVGIYGWTVSPLREYYILDDWGSTKPAGVASDGTPRTAVGTITVDGDTYDVWKHTQTNKPAITGNNQTFDQYFSVRQTARQCGHISISEHFSKWTGLGLQLGNLEEAKLLVEAQSSSGTIDFTTATVVVK